MDDLAFEGGHGAEDEGGAIASHDLGRLARFADKGDAFVLPIIVYIEGEGRNLGQDTLPGEDAEGVLECFEVDPVLPNKEV